MKGPEPLHRSHKDWIRKRAGAVKARYTVFDALVEFGLGDYVPDNTTAAQLSCPFHGADATPSARYYPAEGSGSDHFHCFRCKLHLGSIDLFGKFKGLSFMDALKELEKRLRILVPARPEEEPVPPEEEERGADYVSGAWADVPRVLEMLDRKLVRLRGQMALADFVKFCRVLDAVRWDFDKAAGKVTPDMVRILGVVREKMDAAAAEEPMP